MSPLWSGVLEPHLYDNGSWQGGAERDLSMIVGDAEYSEAGACADCGGGERSRVAGAPFEGVDHKSQSSKVQLRVLHGPTGAAGQPFAVSRAQRRLGLHADCVCIDQSKFGYGADRRIELLSDDLGDLSRFISDVVSEYDVFHFYFRPFFQFETRRLHFPTGLDLLALRAAGKTVIFHYRGSEVRTAERFRALSPFNYVDENPHGLFDKFPEATVDAFMAYVRGVAHEVLVPDPELQSYVPGSKIVPRAIDLCEWEYLGVPDDEVPLVVHAPSRRVVKGTDWVLDAVQELKNEGLSFRFMLVENLTNAEARDVYRQASIVVDQLRIGWYGVLAVEAMALGKATISYIREDLVHHLESDMPLAVADPTTLKNTLRTLITDSEARRRLGERGRAYVERVHDADRVAMQLADMYRAAAESSKPVCIRSCLEYLQVQRQHTQGLYKKLIKRSGHVPRGIWKYLYLIEQQGMRRATGQVLRRVAGMVSPRKHTQ